MDPNSCYILKIKLLGNREKARKDLRCFSFEKFVDHDTTNFKNFVESMVNQYPPGYKEVPHIQYYDDVLRIYPEVKTDQELMGMFEKYIEIKVVTVFIAYSDPSKPYQPIKEWCSDEQSQPMQEETNNSTHLDEDCYLQNPFPENELVGVDEETIYLPNEPVNALDVIRCSNREEDRDYIPEDEYESDSEVEEDEEDELDGNDREAEHVPHAEYDKDDPPMTVGSTYPSMEEFKLALSQHPIKHEFEYNTEYSAPYRFRANCARKVQDKCPWRIHASVKEDLGTVMVKKNPYDHDCSSTRRKKKVKNATRHWIAAKVKDFLIDDPTVRAKVLQQKLKEHHKVSINYRRVYMGKELALKQLYGDWDSSFDNLYRFRFVVNLHERTYSRRKWQVCGIPCKHAISFITSLHNAPLENYVDMYYSIEKFRAVYRQLIPAMVDKSQWPKSDHRFFMHPPLLKATAGRPKSERYKGCTDKKGNKGKHKYPICTEYGHHWHKCKKGNAEDIAALMAMRGPPKKKRKTIKSSQTSIVPLEGDEVPASSMSFPPSRSLESATATKGKLPTQNLEGPKGQEVAQISLSQSLCVVSKQLYLSMQRPQRKGSNHLRSNQLRSSQLRNKEKNHMLSFDSPAMATRSKKIGGPDSPTMSTRSKRKLSL